MRIPKQLQQVPVQDQTVGAAPLTSLQILTLLPTSLWQGIFWGFTCSWSPLSACPLFHLLPLRVLSSPFQPVVVKFCCFHPHVFFLSGYNKNFNMHLLAWLMGSPLLCNICMAPILSTRDRASARVFPLHTRFCRSQGMKPVVLVLSFKLFPALARLFSFPLHQLSSKPDLPENYLLTRTLSNQYLYALKKDVQSLKLFIDCFSLSQSRRLQTEHHCLLLWKCLGICF